MSKTPCASVIIRERFFDLRPVAAGSQDELQQDFSQFIFLYYIVCEGRYSFFIKKKFLFRCPHTLTIRLKRPVYRGFSGEGKCEGKKQKTLTDYQNYTEKKRNPLATLRIKSYL